MERLASIWRRPGGLVATLSERREPFSEPKPGDPAGPLPALDPYVEGRVSLDELPPSLARPTLQAAWNALAEADRLSAELWESLQLVLEETVVDPAALSSARLPPLPAPAGSRRSAAHPRGYAGTKYQPPKAPQSRSQCLPELVCSRGGLSQLLERCAPDSPWRARARRQAQLPPALERGLLWPLRQEDEHLDQLLGLWWALDLAHDAPLRRCLSRLLATDASAGLAWGHALVAELPHRRVHLAELILESAAASRVPAPDQVAVLGELSRRSRDGVFRQRLHFALCQLNSCGDLGFLVEGFELANCYREDHAFSLPWSPAEACRVGPLFADFLARLHAEEAIWSGYELDLWRRCLRLPGFAELLSSPGWRELKGEAAQVLCSGLGALAWEEPPELIEHKWAVVREVTPSLLEVLRRIPSSHQERAARSLSTTIWRWDEEPRLRQALSAACEVLPAICRPPFSTDTEGDVVMAALLGSGLPLAPLRSGARPTCRALDHACARRDDAQLVRQGLESLCELRPDLVETTLNFAPTPLLRCAKLLGILPPPQRTRALRHGEQDLLSDQSLASVDAVGLVELIDGLRLSCAQPLIRRRLRAHTEGLRVLSPSQLARERKRILLRLPELRLSQIRRRVLDLLGEPYELPGELEEPLRHALLMQPFAKENRRALRRVIRAYAAGDKDYLERHPANREWLRAHPRIHRKTWREGLTQRARLDGEEVVLSLERDPLEVLRLGTHVGSCLGLGGVMAHSAVAIMLDVNKAVVFARAGDQVLGRQVLAISEGERLVPHAVYPSSVAPALRELFKTYDEAFARQLGLPLEPPDAETEIELVLAERWYEDGTWDRCVKDDVD